MHCIAIFFVVLIPFFSGYHRRRGFIYFSWVVLVSVLYFDKVVQNKGSGSSMSLELLNSFVWILTWLVFLLEFHLKKRVYR